MKQCRKSIRLKMYDYTQKGAYAVTICVNAHKCMFGCVRNSEMILNDLGNMIVDNWCKLPQRFSNIEMNEFIVMPNHLHGIINIVGAGSPRPDNGSLVSNILVDTVLSDTKDQTNYSKGHGIRDKGRGNPAPTLGQIVAYFKYGTTKQINIIRKTPGTRLWQRNFYEHIIRNEHDLICIREYIKNNPAGWEEDEYYDQGHLTGKINIVGAGLPRPDN